MNKIHNILNSLKKNEITIIEKYLSLNSRSEKKKALLHLITTERITDETALAIRLYGKPTNTIKKLKERLLSDIEDVILMRQVRSDSLSVYRKVESEVIRSLLVTFYYLQNGLLPEAEFKLKKISKLLSNHDSILLEVIYRDLYCNYLGRTNSERLDDELSNLSNLLLEYVFFNKLKTTNVDHFSRFRLDKMSSDNSLSNYDEDNRFYTTCFKQLVQIKFLLSRNEILPADKKLAVLYKNLDNSCNRIPPEMIVDAIIQRIKINIIKGNFQKNDELLRQIRAISITDESLTHEYLSLKFINLFKQRQYELCQSLLKYFNTDLKLRNSLNRTIYARWQYFNSCLLFIKQDFSKLHKLISLFPGKPIANYSLHVNMKLVEIYSFITQNKLDLALIKIASLKQNMGKFSLENIKRYNYIIDKLEAICNSSVTKANDYGSVPGEDILNLELIPVEFIENQLKIRKPKHQYVY